MYEVRVPVIGYAIVCVVASSEPEAEQYAKKIVENTKHLELVDLEIANNLVRTIGMGRFPVKITKL